MEGRTDEDGRLALSIVNAPHRHRLSAKALARCLTDEASAGERAGHVLAFFVDVPVPLQRDFIARMKIDARQVARMARHFAALSGYDLALAS